MRGAPGADLASGRGVVVERGAERGESEEGPRILESGDGVRKLDKGEDNEDILESG